MWPSVLLSTSTSHFQILFGKPLMLFPYISMNYLVVLFWGFYNVAHFLLLISVSTNSLFVIVHRSSFFTKFVAGEPGFQTFKLSLARLWSFSISQIHRVDRRTDLTLELNIANFVFRRYHLWWSYFVQGDPSFFNPLFWHLHPCTHSPTPKTRFPQLAFKLVGSGWQRKRHFILRLFLRETEGQCH